MQEEKPSSADDDTKKNRAQRLELLSAGASNRPRVSVTAASDHGRPADVLSDSGVNDAA